MHEGEIVVRIDILRRHQAAQGGSVLVVKRFLVRHGFIAANIQNLLNVKRNLFVDLGKEIGLVGIERVVQIENPGLDTLVEPQVLPVGMLALAGQGAFTGHGRINVPAPPSVKSSRSTAWGPCR